MTFQKPSQAALPRLLRCLQTFRIGPENQIANVGVETAPPVRKISWYHDHVARTDVTAHAALDARRLEIRALRIRTGAGGLLIDHRATGNDRRAAFEHVINLGHRRLMTIGGLHDTFGAEYTVHADLIGAD